MSRLDELIQELCPDGVEYKQLKEILTIKNGSDYKSFPEGNVPVYGSGGIMTYIDRAVYDKPSVLIPRKGSIDKLYYVDTPFWNVDTIFYTDIDIGKVIPRYVYHCLKKEHLEKLNTAGGVPSLTQAVLNSVTIPVPPLEVQREIVRILDNFTEVTCELTEKLTAELIARRQQFSYYCVKLLERPENRVDMVCLSELGKWSGGKTPTMANSDYWKNGTIPWISSKDMKIAILEDTEDHITEKAVEETGITVFPEGIITIVVRSGILKHSFPIAYVPFMTTVNQDIKALIVRKGISSKYVFHAIQGYADDIRAKTKKQGGTVDSLDFQKVLDYKIPFPSLYIQERLVEVLDNFQDIYTNLENGLPAEIEARQKQYEYYRDKLLTFKEKTA